MRIEKWFVILFPLIFAGCAAIQEKVPIFGKREIRVGGVYKENLDSDRLVDLVIVKKLTGKKRLALFPTYAPYLEGYIRGVIVDYDDNPIEGIVVRVTDRGRDLPGYDPGVSDPNGVYRIRFSHPIKRKRVELRGSIVYNPPWQQQLDILGSALEPQTKETKFRLYYDQKAGIIGIGEDIPKTLTRKVSGTIKEAKKDEKKEKGADKKGGSVLSPPDETSKRGSGDFFEGFGEFGKE